MFYNSFTIDSRPDLLKEINLKVTMKGRTTFLFKHVVTWFHLYIIFIYTLFNYLNPQIYLKELRPVGINVSLYGRPWVTYGETV